MEIQSSEECPICMEGEGIESKHIKCRQCVHTICKTCFDSLSHKKCPFCTKDYVANNHIKLMNQEAILLLRMRRNARRLAGAYSFHGTGSRVNLATIR